MRSVLGIDAAWTATQPSGVALAVKPESGWRLIAVASSYEQFQSLAAGCLDRSARARGSIPSASQMLESCQALTGHAVDLVAVDMPLAFSPIVQRRTSDNEVSRAYGGRKCGTHSPSCTRPGPISDKLRIDFDNAGYRLQTHEICLPALIEVYPHPALVELARASERLKYKVSRSRGYWPSLTPVERRSAIHTQWASIIALLETQLSGVSKHLEGFEHRTSGADMKATEDAIDAIICAWVGICALEGRARPFGDQDSAIWIPKPGVDHGASVKATSSM